MISCDVADLPGDGPHIELGDSPGLGVDVDPERVRELSIFTDTID